MYHDNRTCRQFPLPLEHEVREKAGRPQLLKSVLKMTTFDSTPEKFRVLAMQGLGLRDPGIQGLGYRASV